MDVNLDEPQIKEYTRYYVEVWSDWSDSWFKASEYKKNRVFDNGLKDAQEIARLYIENNKKCRIIKEYIKRTIVEE
jgi:hypothetical protein